jgi:hypothetical protein
MEPQSEIAPSSFGTRFKVEVAMLIALAVLTAAQIFFKDKFVSLVEPFVGGISFVIAASIAAVLPGIAYKSEEWYVKLFTGEQFSTREKRFIVFLIEVGVALALAVVAQQLIIKFLPQFIKYAWVLLVEWLLLLYVFFTRIKHYGFPWFYLIATNIILAVFAYVTYRFV